MSAHNMSTDYSNQQKLVGSLLNKHCYPHAVGHIRLVETHISWVLLAGRYAYKIKKSLDLGFLDFTSLEARQFYCSEEIRLNRRLASRIYLDVISIGGSFDAPEFGVLPAIEYAVRMRRFATSKQLDHLLEKGKVLPQQLDNFAVSLANFHEGLPRALKDSTFGPPATLCAAAMQNFEQLFTLLTDPADQEVLTELKSLAEKNYTTNEKYFVQRQQLGWIRECHGDLHLGNIVLVDTQLVPFDGLEFSPSLRWIDVMDDVAFLVMDLLRHHRHDLAYRFLNAYLEQTGDYVGVSVLPFYLGYRAGVRAKVVAIRAIQSAPGQSAKSVKRLQSQALAACRNYLGVAVECLQGFRPVLIITHGLPGSGKSTFARIALERFGAIHIRSDVERKRLFGLNPLAESHSNTGSGLYNVEATRQTYDRLHALASELLKAGFPVIVDAAFLKLDQRKPFYALALTMNIPFAIVSMKSGLSSLSTRILSRRAKGNDASEADLDVLHRLHATQHPLLPHELERTVEFINEANTETDADQDHFSGEEIVWEKLNGLLAGSAS